MSSRWHVRNKDCVKGGTRNETNSKYEIRITEQEKEMYKEAYLL